MALPFGSDQIEAALDERRLTAKEIARRLHYDRQTIYKWARLGIIPCIRRGHRLRFNWEDVKRWEQRATTGKL